MKKQIIYSPFNEFILRTPLLTMNEVETLSVETLKELLQIPFISEAIYIASHELHSEMIKYLNGGKMENPKRIENALLKYISRMGYRCTPFGLFSGCSIGSIGLTNKIEVNEYVSHVKKSRIDMNYLCSLIQNIELDLEIRENLTYYPNTSLYKIGAELRYVEYTYINSERKHFTISIDNSEYIDRIIAIAKNGATITSLAQSIVEDDITLEVGLDFIHQLIDNQVLVSSLNPSVTGIDFFEKITANFFNHADDDWSEWAKKTRGILLQIDNGGNSSFLDLYKELNKLLLLKNKNANEKYLIQKDLLISCKENSIHQSILNSVNEGLKVINKLTDFQRNENLENFKMAFHSRYETEEIPLSIALDTETGIGYGNSINNSGVVSPLIDDLFINYSNQLQSAEYKWSVIDEIVFNKYIRAIEDKKMLIEITDEDLKDLKEDWSDLPSTISVMTSIFSIENPEMPLVYLDFASGSSASRLLGRFSYLSDTFKGYVDNIMDSENRINENIVLAEIVHLPESRTGNIIHRSSVRDYEIPYLASSTLDIENQISVNDLYVSVRNSKVILKSKKLNKEVKPMLSNAHNYSHNSLPIYNFLCDMQTQDQRKAINFKWSTTIKDKDFLPRVVYKNIIISLGEWKIRKADLTKMRTIDSVKDYFRLKKIPNKVLLADGDNELLINLENDLYIEMFISIIKRRDSIVLKEFLFDTNNSAVKRNNYSFTNELIFSFYKN
ncbi:MULTISPECIES: lantibiotic dehydratase family protein [unclassified Flavobacterium]|uniref:lantibiotic dehydratase family protein n=1 Tax=unclassified Flavobacterium TaxID=196869 RepID=UPI00057C409A|nr:MULTISPECIES: lantibiotic dehydratase family protein [unclassified Flavobacterium]KIA95640.1 hypothetical protein OA93_17980 [Flavobacterium sp. KMS]OUL62829.1 hypothetical protein B8T70_08260 [Flavobacterium sp. AJR]